MDDVDPVVTPDYSQKMIDAITKLGGSPKLTLYPGVGHNAWGRTYSNPELYAWFLAHKRSDRLKPAE